MKKLKDLGLVEETDIENAQDVTIEEFSVKNHVYEGQVQTDDRTHELSVDMTSGEMFCDCERFNLGKKICKHMISLLQRVTSENLDDLDHILKTIKDNGHFKPRYGDDAKHYISTDCEAIDKVFGEGIPKQTISSVFGDWNTGKSIMAHQIAGRVWSEEGKETLYVDSVRGDTEIRYVGEHGIRNREIEKLFDKYVGNKDVFTHKDGTESIDVFDEGLLTFTLSEEGVAFRPISRIFRHKVNKEMYKVTLESGKSVVVTKDHSLIGKNKEPVSPKNLSEGDKLYTLQDDTEQTNMSVMRQGKNSKYATSTNTRDRDKGRSNGEGDRSVCTTNGMERRGRPRKVRENKLQGWRERNFLFNQGSQEQRWENINTSRGCRCLEQGDDKRGLYRENGKRSIRGMAEKTNSRAEGILQKAPRRKKEEGKKEIKKYNEKYETYQDRGNSEGIIRQGGYSLYGRALDRRPIIQGRHSDTYRTSYFDFYRWMFLALLPRTFPRTEHKDAEKEYKKGQRSQQIFRGNRNKSSEILGAQDTRQSTSCDEKDKIDDRGIGWNKERITKIENLGRCEEYVYDLEIPEHHNFVGNGVFVHNTEQQFVGLGGEEYQQWFRDRFNIPDFQIDYRFHHRIKDLMDVFGWELELEWADGSMKMDSKIRPKTDNGGNRINKIRDEFEENNYGLLVVDSITEPIDGQMGSSEASFPGRYPIQKRLLKQIRSIAVEYNVPAFVTMHLSKGVRQYSKPKPKGGKGTGYSIKYILYMKGGSKIGKRKMERHRAIGLPPKEKFKCKLKKDTGFVDL